MAQSEKKYLEAEKLMKEADKLYFTFLTTFISIEFLHFFQNDKNSFSLETWLGIGFNNVRKRRHIFQKCKSTRKSERCLHKSSKLLWKYEPVTRETKFDVFGKFNFLLYIWRGFSAGKNYDAAAMMAKDLNSSEEAADLYEKASMFYRQENSPDKAAETLLKASKYGTHWPPPLFFFWMNSSELTKISMFFQIRCVEDLNPDRAIQLSIAACDLYQEEEKELFSGQAFRSTISLLLRNNK